MSLVPLTTFPSANKSTGFIIALPTATEVSISFQRPVSTAAARCARRLLRAQAWWLLTLKPLWTKPPPDSRPMHNAAHPYLEEPVGGLAGPIRSTPWRDADAQYIPIQVVRLCYHHVSVCCWSRSDREHIHSCRSEYPRQWACRDSLGRSKALGHIPISGSVGSRDGHVVRQVRTLLAQGDV